jgi:hypothetical protein
MALYRRARPPSTPSRRHLAVACPGSGWDASARVETGRVVVLRGGWEREDAAPEAKGAQCRGEFRFLYMVIFAVGSWKLTVMMLIAGIWCCPCFVTGGR